jgi:hypothetical protein
VFVFYSNKIDDFYFGESDDYIDKLTKINSGFYDVLPNFPKAKDWTLHMLLECDSKAQAVRVLKHLRTKPSVSYLKNLADHHWLRSKFLKKFAS